MIIRRLRGDEWDRLEPIFSREFKELPPDAKTSCVIVAEESGCIVGVLCCQLMLHAEPLWVAEEHRKGTTVMKMVKRACEVLHDANYCLASVTSTRMMAFLERLGFVRRGVTYTWLRKEQHG